MDLTISMLAYNGIDLTVACLESIPAATGKLDVETILVDNGSTDGTSDTVLEKFPWVKLIRNEQNCGFSIAVNQGLEVARGGVVLVLNNDTKLVPGCLERVVEFMNATEDAGLVTPQLIYDDGRLQNSIANFPSFAEMFIGKSILKLLMPRRFPSKMQEYREPTVVESVVGAAMFIRRDALDKVGGIDERFFIFYEETDWCMRVRDAGFKLYLIPDAKIIHHQGQTVNRVHVRKRIEYTRSLFLYFKKNHRGSYGLLRLLYPIKNLFETLFSFLGFLLTLGLSRRARRRLIEKSGCLWWQIRGCPRKAGLRPHDLRPPPATNEAIRRPVV